MFSNRRRDLKRKRMILAGLCVLAVLLFICIYNIWSYHHLPIITIQANDVSMYPDEELPAFSAKAVNDKDIENIVLDSKEGYSVKDFMDAMNKGEGYQLVCDYETESEKEGEYPIKVILSEELKEKISNDWKNTIRVEVKEGTLQVKNILGEWDGDKFKLRDDTYVTDEFLCLNDETYYFDKDGNKVTGTQEIWGKEYYFDENGKFDKEKNKVNPALPMIALTFDDGPSQYTEKLLDALEEYDARATFFMVGQNVKKRPEIVERMKEIGCEIGNHTTNHKRLTELKKNEIVTQIEKTNGFLEDVIGEGASVIRPPYGAVNDLVKESVNQPLVLWNVDTLDWKSKDTEKVKTYTLEIVKDGDIILMHDLYETTVDAVIEMIPELLERGYQLVTVSEMAQAHGVQMEAGEKYYSF